MITVGRGKWGNIEAGKEEVQMLRYNMSYKGTVYSAGTTINGAQPLKVANHNVVYL